MIADFRRADALWWLIAVTGVAGLLALLCLAYANHFQALGLEGDLWFGSDIPRHVMWALDPGERFRSHLHPGAFLLFKAWGAILRGFEWAPSPNALIVFAPPIIAITAVSLALVSVILVHRGRYTVATRTAILIGMLLVSPLVAFGPMPESHVLGGVALLLQSALTLMVLRARAASVAGSESWYRAAPAAVCGVLATSFTLSNLVPASILLLPTLPRRWPNPVPGGLGKIVVAGAVMAALAVSFLLGWVRLLSSTAHAVAYEFHWLTLPNRKLLELSFRNLVVFQFGLPPTALYTWHDSLNGRIVTSVSVQGSTILQVVACGLWIAGITFWVLTLKRKSAEYLFLLCCVAAALSLIVFHASYATNEAYMFSPHIWPYILLPGVLAWIENMRARRFAGAICITVAVALSAVQQFAGVRVLLGLPGNTGARAVHALDRAHP